jgi:hypothetical protein
MASTQITSGFSITDASTEALKQLFSSYEMDKQVFYPRLRGTNPKTLPFTTLIAPQSQPVFGQISIYQIDLSADFVLDLVLEIALSAVNGGVGATFSAYKDGVGDFCMQEVRFYQAGTLLYSKRYDFQSFENLTLEPTYAKYQSVQEACGYLPLGTRIARAAGQQVFYVPIRSFLDYMSCPISALTSPIRMEITWRPMLNLIQYDGVGPTASILTANIRPHYINVNPELINEIAMNGQKGPVLFPFIDVSHTRIDLQAGIANVRFLLTEFKSIVTWMGFHLQETQQQDDITGNPLFELSNTVGFQNWNVEDKGVFLASTPQFLTPDYVNLHVIPYDFECYFDIALRNIRFNMVWPFGVHPQADTHENSPVVIGYFDFSKTQSAFLDIVNPASANALRLTAFGAFANVLIYVNGSLKKYTL